MFIPIRTDWYSPRARKPLITPVLIAVNVAVQLIGFVGPRMGWFTIDQFIEALAYDPRHRIWWQLLSSAFVHDPHGIWHIALNMLFLWVFGIAVESRLGRIGFLCFYLAGAVAATLGHDFASDSSVIGASGAVSAVVGAFLALFPRSNIVVLFLLNMSQILVPAGWFIGLYFLIDLLNQFTSFFGVESSTAYMAHLAGYVFGFFVCFALLGMRILKREEVDVFFLFKQMRRRAAFRAASRGSTGGLWESAQKDTGEQLARRAKKRSTILEADEKEIAERRAEIGKQIAAHDLAGAAELYRAVLQDYPDIALAESRQLDVANQIYAEGDFANAAKAYELFLRQYPRAGRADEVRLLLSVCYARRLGQPDRARALLEEARPRLDDAGHASLADQLLAELSP